jgi:putative addiction module component (TIGR02574 family)
MQAEKSLEEALKLEPVERERVAYDLLECIGDSVGVDLSPAWEEELQRRLRDTDSGRVEMSLGEQVFADLEAASRSRRAPR